MLLLLLGAKASYSPFARERLVSCCATGSAQQRNFRSASTTWSWCRTVLAAPPRGRSTSSCVVQATDWGDSTGLGFDAHPAGLIGNGSGPIIGPLARNAFSSGLGVVEVTWNQSR